MPSKTKKVSKPITTPKEVIVEALGVFMLVFFGGYSGLANLSSYAGIKEPLAPSIAVPAILYNFIGVGAPISGAHYNPAMSMVFYLIGEKSLATTLVYIAVQFLASIFSAWMIVLTQDEAYDDFMPYPKLNPRVPVAKGFIFETLGTFILILIAVMGIKQGAELETVALRIALLIGLLINTIGPFSGCCLNPAVVVGPALFDKDGFFQRGWWIYHSAPYLGALLGYIIGGYLGEVDSKEEAKKAVGDALKKASTKTMDLDSNNDSSRMDSEGGDQIEYYNSKKKGGQMLYFEH